MEDSKEIQDPVMTEWRKAVMTSLDMMNTKLDALSKRVDTITDEKNSEDSVHEAQMSDLISPVGINQGGMPNGTEDMFEKMARRKALLNVAQTEEKTQHPLSSTSLRSKRIVAFAKKAVYADIGSIN